MKPGTRNLLIAVVAVALFAASFGIAWAVIRSGEDAPDLKAIHDDCVQGASEVGEHVEGVSTASDDGKSIQVKTSVKNWEVSAGAAISACILRETGASDATIAKVGQASASLGRQTDSYGDYEVTYSYVAQGADGGLSVIFELVD